MTEIVVTGSAERRLSADRAVVTATVSIAEGGREAVVREAAAAHGKLVARAVAEGYARAIGATGVELLSIRDGSVGRPAPIMRAMSADPSAPEVTVREVEVSVGLEATFRA